MSLCPVLTLRSGEREGELGDTGMCMGPSSVHIPEGWLALLISFTHPICFPVFSSRTGKFQRIHKLTFHLHIMQHTKYLLKWLPYIQRTNLGQRKTLWIPEATKLLWILLPDWTEEGLNGCVLSFPGHRPLEGFPLTIRRTLEIIARLIKATQLSESLNFKFPCLHRHKPPKHSKNDSYELHVAIKIMFTWNV